MTLKTPLFSLVALFFAITLPVQAQDPAPAPPADEIYMKNGDRISGKIVTMTGGEMKVETAYAGEVTLKLDAIETFVTGSTIDLVMADGSKVKAKTRRAPGGAVILETESLPIGEPVSLGTVSGINPPAREPVRWTGDLTAAYVATRGNTDTDKTSFAARAVRRSEDDRITAGAGYTSSRDKDPATRVYTTTERRVYGNLKYDYFFAEDWFVYANLAADKDAVKFLDLRFNAGVGVGHQIVDDDDLSAYIEAGISWFFEDYDRRFVPAGTDTTNDTLAARVAWDVRWDIDEDWRFLHNTVWLPGLESQHDHVVQSESALRYALRDNLFVQGAVYTEWDNTPAPGAERIDTRYTLSVGLSF